MTILCSDKTGTLTLNQLALKEPIIYEAGATADDLNFLGSLCSKRDIGNQDAIDKCICDAVPEARRGEWTKYRETHFEPFNPTDKRVVADLELDSATAALLFGSASPPPFMQLAKGAPHKILELAHNHAEIEHRVRDSVQELADRGFRSLGVAINREPRGAPAKWELLGIISLFDPPRPDTKRTIELAVENGIEVKMVTGDHKAIAKETCR